MIGTNELIQSATENPQTLLGAVPCRVLRIKDLLILPLESFLQDPLERSQNVITPRFLQSTEAKISLKGKRGRIEHLINVASFLRDMNAA